MTPDNGRQPCQISDILADAMFSMGYRSVVDGKPFDYEAVTNTWEYERGRQFAIWERSQGKPLRRSVLGPRTPFYPDGVYPDLLQAWRKCRDDGAVL